ncbi:MAG: GNAT family N-acetyltransferase [Rhodocyclaceae bacterium]|jgi:ribosomal protein S18 acetylase RimI-like enzyme|nr:GNAT family N-acetyltransferase [Rhodocyclaceae bacterium]MBP7081322.1 GNAT family N-acetyltransferase [Rhodocyclaceae bacterium]
MQQNISLTPICFAEIAEVGVLARSIWREHFTKIISEAQIEYMLEGRYTEADLVPYIDSTDRWFDVLRVDGVAAGFLRCIRTEPDEFKVEQIYLAQSQRGKGFGKYLLASAETRAQALSCRSIFLYVNRRNDEAIRAYRQFGFAIESEQVVDIGNGFVMDDYVMRKSL